MSDIHGMKREQLLEQTSVSADPFDAMESREEINPTSELTSREKEKPEVSGVFEEMHDGAYKDDRELLKMEREKKKQEQEEEKERRDKERLKPERDLTSEISEEKLKFAEEKLAREKNEMKATAKEPHHR